MGSVRGLSCIPFIMGVWWIGQLISSCRNSPYSGNQLQEVKPKEAKGRKDKLVRSVALNTRTMSSSPVPLCIKVIQQRKGNFQQLGSPLKSATTFNVQLTAENIFPMNFYRAGTLALSVQEINNLKSKYGKGLITKQDEYLDIFQVSLQHLFDKVYRANKLPSRVLLLLSPQLLSCYNASSLCFQLLTAMLLPS